MKKYENIICEVVVLKNNDIVTTSAGIDDGILLPGEDLLQGR